LPYKELSEYQTPSGKIGVKSTTAEKMGLNSFPKPLKVLPPPEYPFMLVFYGS